MNPVALLMRSKTAASLPCPAKLRDLLAKVAPSEMALKRLLQFFAAPSLTSEPPKDAAALMMPKMADAFLSPKAPSTSETALATAAIDASTPCKTVGKRYGAAIMVSTATATAKATAIILNAFLMKRHNLPQNRPEGSTWLTGS